MSADTMKDATGQAGVSIALDDITLFQTVGEKMYIDTDGATLVDDDIAAIVISGKETLTTIRAIVDSTNRGGFLQDAFASESGVGYKLILDGTKGNRAKDVVDNDTGLAALAGPDAPGDGKNDYEDASGNSFKSFIKIAALSIDVSSKCPVSSALATEAGGAGAVNVAGVIIGLPTIEIVKTGDTQTIGITACDAAGTKTANTQKDFIEITKENSVLAILGGTLEIAPH